MVWVTNPKTVVVELIWVHMSHKSWKMIASLIFYALLTTWHPRGKEKREWWMIHSMDMGSPSLQGTKLMLLSKAHNLLSRIVLGSTYRLEWVRLDYNEMTKDKNEKLEVCPQVTRGSDFIASSKGKGCSFFATCSSCGQHLLSQEWTSSASNNYQGSSTLPNYNVIPKMHEKLSRITSKFGIELRQQ